MFNLKEAKSIAKNNVKKHYIIFVLLCLRLIYQIWLSKLTFYGSLYERGQWVMANG